MTLHHHLCHNFHTTDYHRNQVFNVMCRIHIRQDSTTTFSCYGWFWRWYTCPVPCHLIVLWGIIIYIYIIFFHRYYFYATISVVVTSLVVLLWIHIRLSAEKIREILLTSWVYKEHDVIDVIRRLPVWNVKIRRYFASCTLQFWSNLTKISFHGRHFN